MRPELEDVWRREAPHVVTALVRRYGHFDDAEDATQEALFAASVQWPRDGLPNDPRAWLVRVASRRLIDQWLADQGFIIVAVDGAGSLSGNCAVTQSDFKIKPYSALFGALKVLDEVEVEIEASVPTS